MQITQFIFGSILAAIHLFISYSVPVVVRNPVVALEPLVSVKPDIVDVANDTSTGNAGVGLLLKKLALRAAGAEGVAENVGNYEGKLFGVDGHQEAQVATGPPQIY